MGRTIKPSSSSSNYTQQEETVDAYTKFLKDAGILKPEDNPKYDATFALKALEG